MKHDCTGRLDLMKQAAAVDDKMIEQVFSIGSERQRMAFLQSISTVYRVVSSYVIVSCSSVLPLLAVIVVIPGDYKLCTRPGSTKEGYRR
jgi:hypothetical protein